MRCAPAGVWVRIAEWAREVSAAGKPGPPPPESEHIVKSLVLPHLGNRLVCHTDKAKGYAAIDKERPGGIHRDANHSEHQYSIASAFGTFLPVPQGSGLLVIATFLAQRGIVLHI